jgi:DNA-binding NtrC family response regulator
MLEERNPSERESRRPAQRGDGELPSSHVLVVDDEHSIRHFVQCALADAGYHVTMAANGEEAMSRFKNEVPDLVVLDVKLPDADGLDLLAQMKQESPDTPVILITAVADVKKAVEAMKRGAYYFLRKPLALDELEGLVREGLEKRRLKLEVDVLRQKVWQEEGFVRCQSPRMAQVYQIVEQVARGENTSVLIEGESGTGKEHIARNIHKLSMRSTKPFLEINCAAIPRDLLESELFGHEKGAFTDARAQKQGLLELAHGGTLFLDEVGEMSLTLQVKLLRVLERMTFKRVGGVKDISVSVRIISATNQNLEKRVREGAFREDLFYRLKVVPIYVPPLRERREDILPLALHFMQQFNVAFKKDFLRITPDAERTLLEYPWPGNIRELRNLMERMILLETGTELTLAHLQLGTGGGTRAPRGTTGNDLADRISNVLLAPGLPSGGVPCEEILEELERALIIKATEASNGNQSRTAELLQMKRDKLRYRMKLYRMNGGHGADDEGVEQTGT